jgi:hypothetical protein
VIPVPSQIVHTAALLPDIVRIDDSAAEFDGVSRIVHSAAVLVFPFWIVDSVALRLCAPHADVPASVPGSRFSYQ